MSTVLVAVNPTAARGSSTGAERAVVSTLTSAGFTAEVVTGPDEAGLTAALVARLDAPEPPAALVAVGGDGLAHAAVNALTGHDVPLGVVAVGTGNDLARGLGLPFSDPAAAARTAVQALTARREGAAAHRIDLLEITDPSGYRRRAAGVVSLGLDAVVNERANRLTRPRGRLRYDVALLLELPVFVPRYYRLLIDGAPLEGRAMLVCIANAPSIGGGLRICPDARLDDGLLDVAVIEPVSRPELLRVFPRLAHGTHVEHPAVSIRRARHVEVEIGPPPGRAPASAALRRADRHGVVAYADGERLVRPPLTVRVLPRAMSVLAGTVGS